MYVRELNRVCGNGLIYDCGVFCEATVTIIGTSRVQPILQHEDITNSLQELNSIGDTVDKSIKYFEYLVEGNKRLAQLVANKVLIADGLGMLRIPDTKVTEFACALGDYYETGSDKLYRYLTDECLQCLKAS